MKKYATIWALLLSAASFPSMAQQQVCIRPGTNQIDQQATQTFQQMMASADQQTMQAISGVWYSETQSPSTGQVDYQYNSYEPNGLFQYSSRVCSRIQCSDFAGHGMYAAVSQGSGQFTVMLMVSDMSRDRQCTGWTGRFVDQQTIQTANGYMRRTR